MDFGRSKGKQASFFSKIIMEIITKAIISTSGTATDSPAIARGSNSACEADSIIRKLTYGSGRYSEHTMKNLFLLLALVSATYGCSLEERPEYGGVEITYLKVAQSSTIAQVPHSGT